MDEMAVSKVFRFDEMPVRRAPNGGESRNILRGELPTGESVALHSSLQVKGAVPNPAHRIAHSEVILVSEGTVEVLHDEKVERVGPGGVIYIAKGTLHQLKNVGDGPAKYVVVQIGGDTKQ